MLFDIHVFCCVNERPPTHRRGSCGGNDSLRLCNYMCRRAMVIGLGRRVRINLAGCLGACEQGPVMVIYPEGVWYRYETEADVEEILEVHLLHGRRVERLLVALDQVLRH